jgi:hypothetical protein
MTIPRGTRLASIVLLASSLVATGAVAQPGPPHGPEPGATADAPTSELLERLRERIRIMRAWRLTDALALDEPTALRLFEHLDAYDVRIYEQQDALAELGRRLQARLAETSPNEAELRLLIEEITAAHLRIEALRVELVRDSRAFLSAREQAALMLFLPDFDRQIQQLVREVRRPRGFGEGMRLGGGGEPEERRARESRERSRPRWDEAWTGEGREERDDEAEP